MPEEFFVGTTLAGRVLRMFYEHTEYETFTDEEGERVDSPRGTTITATLDGAPIEIEAANWSGDTVTVRSRDHGTFTATKTDYAEDHSEALRRYLEHRRSGGWDVEIVDKSQVGDELHYTVSITNGRLTERAEFHLSARVARTLAKGDARPSDDAVVAAIAETIRSYDGSEIRRLAEEPTTFLWRAS